MVQRARPGLLPINKLIGHWLPRFAIASLEIFKLSAQRIILGRNRAALSFLPVQVFLENGLALLLNL